MTWVIGASTLSGYGVVFSDVRVTFSNGETRDMLQKAYRVGDYIVAGFAGSVYVGFKLLEDLAQRLPQLDADRSWRPEWIAENWGVYAAEVFRNAPDKQKDPGAQVILVGASPDRDLIPGVARTYVATLRSPSFDAPDIGTGPCVKSIGCGSQVADYVEALEDVDEWSRGRVDVDEGPGFAAWASLALIALSERLLDHPAVGVGQMFHGFIIRRGEIIEWTPDNHRRTGLDGVEQVVTMPPLARSYAEFCSMARDAGVAVAEAAAIASCPPQRPLSNPCTDF